VSSRSTRADVARLAEESALMRDRLVELVRTFQGRRRASKWRRVGAAALSLMGLGVTALGARSALSRSRRPRRVHHGSPLRRRMRWALAAGIASFVARRFARRALAP
jgi:hypothetical protein